MPRARRSYSMPVSARSSCRHARLYAPSVTSCRMLWAVRAGVHSRRNARPQSHCARSARGRNSNGASSRPSHFRILRGTRGFAQGWACDTEICPPLANEVSRPAASCRSTSVTSCPALLRYHAEVTPMTPAPSTRTRIPSVEREAHLHRHLPVGHLAILDLAARVSHLEPAQVVQRLGRSLHCVGDGVLQALWRRPGELDGLVDMVRHSAPPGK